MKKITFLLVLSFIFCSNTNSQIKLKLSEKKTYSENRNLKKLNLYNKSSNAGLPPIIIGAIILSVINPELVIENKKVYFGLTKELSIGKYPYGRLAFEYSFIFRNYSRNHLRFSYNYDFIIKTKGDFYAPLVSTGAGYFTDTEHKGIFIQASAGIVLPFPVLFLDGVYAYFKARHTFVKGTENSNITDFSVGMSFLLYY